MVPIGRSARQTMDARGPSAGASDHDVPPQPGGRLLLYVLEGGVERLDQHPGQPW